MNSRNMRGLLLFKYLFVTRSRLELPGLLKISEKAPAILDKYRSRKSKHNFLLPELHVLEELVPYEYITSRKVARQGIKVLKAPVQFYRNDIVIPGLKQP